MGSASSVSDICGRVIFLTMTALPESDAATSLVLIAPLVNRRRIASATAPPSMIAPSTMLSGCTGSLPNAATLNALPAGLSSTALTALEPISRPTRDFALRNTGYVPSCDRPNWLLENQWPLESGAGVHLSGPHGSTNPSSSG